MLNVPPRVNGSDELAEWSTVPEPSKLVCFAASAISAKICPAGALMTRSTLTVFPCTAKD